jgi:hypothetical protein
VGVGYVVSGRVITIMGRQQWKSRRERRAARHRPAGRDDE